MGPQPDIVTTKTNKNVPITAPTSTAVSTDVTVVNSNGEAIAQALTVLEIISKLEVPNEVLQE